MMDKRQLRENELDRVNGGSNSSSYSTVIGDAGATVGTGEGNGSAGSFSDLKIGNISGDAKNQPLGTLFRNQ